MARKNYTTLWNKEKSVRFPEVAFKAKIEEGTIDLRDVWGVVNQRALPQVYVFKRIDNDRWKEHLCRTASGYFNRSRLAEHKMGRLTGSRWS